jgi:hypothetical protein
VEQQRQGNDDQLIGDQHCHGYAHSEGVGDLVDASGDQREAGIERRLLEVMVARHRVVADRHDLCEPVAVPLLPGAADGRQSGMADWGEKRRPRQGDDLEGK